MALIGFLFIMAIGTIACVRAVLAMYFIWALAGFSDRGAWTYLFVIFLLGCIAISFGLAHAPFSITFKS